MSPAYMCVALLLAAGAVGQTRAPAASAEGPALSAGEIVAKAGELIDKLPNLNVTAPPPTAAQQAAAEEGCKLYAAALTQIDRLDPQVARNLSLIGIRSGFGVCDAEMMLSAAKLRWRLEKADNALSEYAAYALAWSGIFAGDSKAAVEALQHLARNSSQEGLKTWAKEMGPVAMQAGKPVQFTLRLIDGGTVQVPQQPGKAVVLDFWSSWSAASIQEMAGLKSFHDKHRAEKDLLMVGIALDGNANDVRQRIAQHGMDWPQAMDRALRGRFAGSGVPHAAVLSAKGYLFWQGHPAMKDSLAWTADFALRQAERLARQQAASQPAPSPEGPAELKPPPQPPGPAVTPEMEAQAENQWKMARMYLRMGMRAKGKETLQELVKKYPGTRAAADAAEELKYLH